MEKFIWTPEYSVKNDTIDEQHKMFFSIANSLTDLVDKPDVTREELIVKVSELGNYAFYHLGTEETMFDAYDYPEEEAHNKTHDAFRSAVTKMMNEVRQPEVNNKEISLKMAEFSGNWLMEHIKVIDQRYADFFVSKGLK